MFQEFYHELQELPDWQTLPMPIYIQRMTAVFDRLVDMLRTPASLKHPELNALAAFAWRVIGTKQIPVVLDSRGCPTLSCVIGMPGLPRACYLLPTHFLELVRHDPVMQLGAVISMASRGRDHVTGHLDWHTVERAAAYEAELLLALHDRHQEEELAWTWNGYQQQLLARYPFGLGSLSPGINYLTPPIV